MAILTRLYKVFLINTNMASNLMFWLTCDLAIIITPCDSLFIYLFIRRKNTKVNRTLMCLVSLHQTKKVLFTFCTSTMNLNYNQNISIRKGWHNISPILTALCIPQYNKPIAATSICPDNCSRHALSRRVT